MLTRAAAITLSVLAVLFGTGASAAAMSKLSSAPPPSLRSAPAVPPHHRHHPGASRRPPAPELPRSGYEVPVELVLATGLLGAGLLLRRRPR